MLPHPQYAATATGADMLGAVLSHQAAPWVAVINTRWLYPYLIQIQNMQIFIRIAVRLTIFAFLRKDWWIDGCIF